MNDHGMLIVYGNARVVLLDEDDGSGTGASFGLGPAYDLRSGKIVGHGYGDGYGCGFGIGLYGVGYGHGVHWDIDLREIFGVARARASTR